MGFFGKGHSDDGDDEGGLTCMISNSQLPDNYEPGRFHIFAIGMYIIVKYLDVVLAAVELERLVAVLGLAFKLPYVPDDSARRATDLL